MKLKNYIFENDFSIIEYEQTGGLNLFISFGNFYLNFKKGKDGKLFIKNKQNLNKIIHINLSLFNVSFSHINLKPKSLVSKTNHSIELIHKNKLPSEDIHPNQRTLLSRSIKNHLTKYFQNTNRVNFNRSDKDFRKSKTILLNNKIEHFKTKNITL